MLADDVANSLVIHVWLLRDAPWLGNKLVKYTGGTNGFVAQWLSVSCCVGMLYPRACVQFLLGARLLFGNPRAVKLVRLVRLIPVNPAVNLSGGNPGIPGVNLINESCQITSIKGQYIQKNSPLDS